jgi:hypothetical protein
VGLTHSDDVCLILNVNLRHLSSANQKTEPAHLGSGTGRCPLVSQMLNIDDYDNREIVQKSLKKQAHGPSAVSIIYLPL